MSDTYFSYASRGGVLPCEHAEKLDSDLSNIMLGSRRGREKRAADLSSFSDYPPCFTRCVNPLSTMNICKPSVGYSVRICDSDLVCEVDNGGRWRRTSFRNL